jgi:FkbM family methyltransferase
MNRIESLLVRCSIVPCLRKSYPLLDRLLRFGRDCHFLTGLNQRFFLAQHLQLKSKVLQFDPSDGRTVKWLYEHLLAGRELPPGQWLVIDIGAHDGFLSSNSYNLIGLGWNAILVEPYRKNYSVLLELLSGRGIAASQRVITRMVAIDETGGEKWLSIDVPGDLCDMEGRLLDAPAGKSVRVETVTVEDLLLKDAACRGLIDGAQCIVLSIDVEGKEWEIIRQFFALRIYAAIVIIETFRLDEARFEQFMQGHGYRKVAKIRWNSIYTLSTLPQS